LKKSTSSEPSSETKQMKYYAQIVNGDLIPNEHEKLLWLPLNKLHTLEWAPADLPTIEALTALNINE
jgi:8-oxo-dGTP diphosphatase